MLLRGKGAPAPARGHLLALRVHAGPGSAAPCIQPAALLLLLLSQEHLLQPGSRWQCL